MEKIVNIEQNKKQNKVKRENSGQRKERRRRENSVDSLI